MQRRVGQHHAELMAPWGNLGGGHRGALRARQHDRVGEAGQQGRLRRGEGDEPLGSLEVTHHQGERLGAALLALAQSRDGVGIGGVAGQVVAADPLDREDTAVGEQSPSLRETRPLPAPESSSGWTKVSVGPQSGQQMVSAWKRRSPGSSYSRRQAAQSAKPAIVVAGRS